MSCFEILQYPFQYLEYPFQCFVDSESDRYTYGRIRFWNIHLLLKQVFIIFCIKEYQDLVSFNALTLIRLQRNCSNIRSAWYLDITVIEVYPNQNLNYHFRDLWFASCALKMVTEYKVLVLKITVCLSKLKIKHWCKYAYDAEDCGPLDS